MEITAVNMLGSLYMSMGNLEKALLVYQGLIQSIETYYLDQTGKAKTYPTILYNTTKVLCKLGEYERAILYCKIGLDCCIENNKSLEIPLLLNNHAWCLIKLGRNDEARPLLKQAYFYFLAIKNKEFATIVKKYYSEVFNIEIE